ncbi:hypothetical protein [Mesorhizobium delmotii]|uniref:Uncharacterized protein n=1 Tax=Mesorhizobium delmotii TaxID=1631247 RepID=A0A2P9APK5_9HYPH|nr:hypothetical protein [Mesorhizobium delmotii]SJM33056.1 hypothetical protein BQ8482_330191 [Mesorhizobium delmotii]
MELALISDRENYVPSDHSTPSALPVAMEAYRRPCVGLHSQAPMTNKETSNNYGDIIVTLNDTTRIINCPNNIQWIVQTLSGRRWRSCSFWRRRDALINQLDFEAQADGDYALTPENRKALEALPRIHGCV